MSDLDAAMDNHGKCARVYAIAGLITYSEGWREILPFGAAVL